MEGTTASGVVTRDLSKVGMILDCNGGSVKVLVNTNVFAPSNSIGNAITMAGVDMLINGLARTFCAEEFAGNVESFAPNDNYLLTVK